MTREAAVASLLDGRYTFETFVVGGGNRLAYAAAKSVAETPGGDYSPLLIHAKRGLGKTHLLGAIGRQALLHDPARAVRYASMESLSEDGAAPARGSIGGGGGRLQEVDLLLLDDLQRVAGNPRAQTRLLQAMEALARGRKQVVLACDRMPEEIPALDERVLAGVRAGLIVDVQSPDDATRAAIVRFKMRERGADVSPEVVEELAARDFSNVRELEEVLRKLVALRSPKDGPLTPARVRELLHGSLPPRIMVEERPDEFADFLANVADTITSVLDAPDEATGFRRQPKRAARQATSVGAPKDPTFIRSHLLQPHPAAGAPARAVTIDPFFADPYKVFLHWEPLSDRLVERLAEAAT